MPIPLYRPHFKRKDLESALSTLVVDAVGNGEQSRLLVKELAQGFGCEGGQSIRDQERACEIALKSLRLAPGSRVAISVLAPSRWLRATELSGLVPVFLDLAKNSVQLPNEISEPFEVLVLYHHFGLLQSQGSIEAHYIIEDISEGFLISAHEGHAHLIVLSLEAESLVTGGGGSVILAKSKQELQNLSLCLEDFERSVKLSDLNASLARTQILDVNERLASRKSLVRLYEEALKDSRHAVFESSDENFPQHAFPLLVQSNINEIMAYAQKKNLEIALAFSDSILARGLVPEGEIRFPHALSLMMRTLVFPLHSFITAKESQEICRILSTLP